MSRDHGGPSLKEMGLKQHEIALPKQEAATGDPTRDQASADELKPLYRGVWADKLQDGMELPVGGSLLHDRMTLKLRLDFSTFDSEVERYTEEKIKALYEKNEVALKAWLKTTGSDVDPYTFYVCNLVQNKMQELLQASNAEDQGLWQRRSALYKEGAAPALSELKGSTQCTERAAMAQYLLQRAGVESVYVGGITMQDANDGEEYPEDHAYIVLKNPKDAESSYIFDPARPRSQQNLPRVLKTDVPITYELLKDKRELLVRAKEVLQGGELWFGVGAPVAGKQKIIQKAK